MYTSFAKTKNMKIKLVVISAIGLLTCLSLKSQTLDEQFAEDVQSIKTIINAYYDVISGASTDPWQFERDKYIHSPNAIITRLDDMGNAEAHALETEYIPMGLAPRENFYEKELKRETAHFGNMAHVWSAFEIRTEPEDASNLRGLNSIQLHFEKGRWFTDSWTAEMESETNGLVIDFIEEK